MKKYLICCFVLLFSAIQSYSQTNTTTDGNWTTGGNWDNGVPAGGDVANIHNQMTLNTNLTISGGTYNVNNGTIIDALGGTAYDITLSGSGYFEVGGDVTIEGDFNAINFGDLVIKGCDTLTIGGDVEFRNNSQFNIEACGVLIIEGDLNLRNNHNSQVDGNIVVKGNLNSRNNAVIVGTGNIEVDGTIDISNSASIFGNTSDCTPGPCSYGPGGSLPIELISFDAILLADGTVQLDWVTASEINNDYFTIERADNNSPFNEISVMSGAGNSQQTLSYAYTDDTPLAENTYYRLKQTDFDGKFTHSETKRIKADPYYLNQQLHLYPNPASQNLNVTNTMDGISSLKIMNNSGMIVFQEMIQEGSPLVVLDVSALSTGFYFVLQESQVEHKTAKLSISR